MTSVVHAAFETGARSEREARDGGIAGAARGVLAALDWLPVAVLAVERNGRIVHRNRRAERYLERCSGIRESHGRLRCEFSYASAHFERALAGLANGEANGPNVITARRGDGGRPLELLLLPPEPGGPVIVFAFDPDEDVGCNQGLARRLYGLSERESEVAQAVVTGRTLEEIAESLGVDKETVRSHLKHVFAKTHTSRQSELVRLLSIGLFGLGTEK